MIICVLENKIWITAWVIIYDIWIISYESYLFIFEFKIAIQLQIKRAASSRIKTILSISLQFLNKLHLFTSKQNIEMLTEFFWKKNFWAQEWPKSSKTHSENSFEKFGPNFFSIFLRSKIFLDIVPFLSVKRIFLATTLEKLDFWW